MRFFNSKLEFIHVWKLHKVACKHALDSSYAQATHNLTQRVSMAGIKGTHFFLGAIPASFPDVALTPTIKPVVPHAHTRKMQFRCSHIVDRASTAYESHRRKYQWHHRHLSTALWCHWWSFPGLHPINQEANHRLDRRCKSNIWERCWYCPQKEVGTFDAGHRHPLSQVMSSLGIRWV